LPINLSINQFRHIDASSHKTVAFKKL